MVSFPRISWVRRLMKILGFQPSFYFISDGKPQSPSTLIKIDWSGQLKVIKRTRWFPDKVKSKKVWTWELQVAGSCVGCGQVQPGLARQIPERWKLLSWKEAVWVQTKGNGVSAQRITSISSSLSPAPVPSEMSRYVFRNDGGKAQWWLLNIQATFG